MRVITQVSGAIAFAVVFVVLSVYIDPIKAAAVMFGLIAGAVLFLYPEIALILAVATIPLEGLGRVTASTSLNVISIAKLFGLIALLGWIYRTILYREKPLVPKEFLLLCLFLIIGVITLFYTSDLPHGMARTISFFSTFIFFLLIVNLIQSHKLLIECIAALLIVTAGIGVFALIQRYLPQYTIFSVTDTGIDAMGVYLDLSEQAIIGEVIMRSSGTTGSPHVYAGNLLVAIPLYFYFMRITNNVWVRFACLAGLILAFINLVLTQTRAGLIACIIALAILLYKRVIKFSPLLVLGVICGVIIAIPLLPDTVYARLFDIQNYTVKGSDTLQARLHYWESGLEMLKENWLFGMGIGNFSELAKYQPLATPGHSFMHNIYLQMFNEVGIFGLATLLIFFVAIWRNFATAEHHFHAIGQHNHALLSSSLFVSFLSMLILGMSIDFLHFAIKDWWFIVALSIFLKMESVRLYGSTHKQSYEH